MSDAHKFLTSEQLWLLRQANTDKVVIRLLDEIEAMRRQLDIAEGAINNFAYRGEIKRTEPLPSAEEINAHLISALTWVKQRYEDEWTYEMGVGEVVSEIIQRFEEEKK